MRINAYFLNDYRLTVKANKLRAVPDVAAVQLVRPHVVATFDRITNLKNILILKIVNETPCNQSQNTVYCDRCK